jgi:serine/threonine protein phosphatase 1
MQETRYFVCSDLHGQYDLWKQIKEYITENDKLIFLGDAIDRGEDGIKIMQEMFADDRVIYLLGNHEDMMLDWWLSRGETREETNYLKHWFENGGRPTYEAFLALAYEERIQLIENIKKLNYEMEIEYQCEDGEFKIYLNHAGSNPHRARHDRFTCTWDRSHFNHRWPKGNNDMIIHGHTPRQILDRSYCVEFDKDLVTYCNGHKVCLDWGCFAIGAIPLYNLNELCVEKIFYKEEEEII